MSQNIQDYKDILAELDQAADIGEARRLCSRFLKMTESAMPDLSAPNSPEKLLMRLLQGVEEGSETVEKLWASITGSSAKKYIATVIVRENTEPISQELLDTFRTSPGTWGFRHMNYMVLVSAELEGFYDSAEFRAALQKNRLCAGLSRPFSSIAQFPVAYEEALATLRSLRILRKGKFIAGYDDFLMLRLLEQLREDVDPDHFCLPDVRQLQEYDKKHNSDLCRTLLCYLENAQNVGATASQLNIHRNTVHYRVNRCMEILPKLDFSNGYMAFLLLLSLYIIEHEDYRTKRTQAQGIL